MPSCMSRQHPKRFENQTGTRPRKWVNSMACGPLRAIQNVQIALAEALHRKAELLRGLGNRFKAPAPVLGVLGLKPQLHVALYKV